MRLFAGLPLPRPTCLSLAAALEQVRGSSTGIRWVRPEGFHLTLHFFGDVDEAQRAALVGALQDARLRRDVIHARLGALGQFPPHGEPRVVWASLAQGGDQALSLWDVFEQVVEPLGWQRDPRGFTPHITVGRAGRGGPVRLDPVNGVLPGDPFVLAEIVLFESVLGRDGAVYSPQAKVVLSPGAA
ncbi:MAG TPA: RNA 2',3'-cyclic phosphodiesterase [bacterium]|nr:RNA 2',3'-cyclic phosphodiesterase [bacterium]